MNCIVVTNRLGAAPGTSYDQRMSLIEMLQDRSPPMAAVLPAGEYLLCGRHVPSGGTVNEGHVDLLSVVARGAELIRAGYDIDIRSRCGLH